MPAPLHHSPVNAVAWLANIAGPPRHSKKAGEVILSGAGRDVPGPGRRQLPRHGRRPGGSVRFH
jgi:2-keto-4-pentenoate hydratase